MDIKILMQKISDLENKIIENDDILEIFVNDDDEKCVICFSSDEKYYINYKCNKKHNHYYCVDCVKKWNGNKCLVCMKERIVRNMKISVNYQI